MVIDTVIKQLQQAQQISSNTTNEKENDNKKIHWLLLPYQRDEDCNIIKSMNKCVNKLLPNNNKIEITLKSTKALNWAAVSMSKTNKHDLIYHMKCPEPICIDDYVGESARRIKDHDGRDHTSHVLKHSIEKSYKDVNTIDFKIIDKNFHNSTRKQKIAEAI